MPRPIDLVSAPPPPRILQEAQNNGRSGNDINPSILIITVIVVVVIFVSASLHLLLRYFSRHCNSQEDDDDVAPIEPVHVSRISSRRVLPEDHQTLINSLPLFSFNSVSGLRSSADCAVCLSKFEPPDQLRLLPICCHAFHSRCIDTWLTSNRTCPLCRSTIQLDESSDYLKLFSPSSSRESFRLEVGSVSHRRTPSDLGHEHLRSYSMGSFDYIVEEESVLEVESTHQRGNSDCSFDRKKDEASFPATDTHSEPPGPNLAAEVGGGRGWLKDYVDKLTSSSSSFSSRALSFRISGKIFTGSSRRSEAFTGSSRRSDVGASGVYGGGSWDSEGTGYGEELGGFLRWLSGL